MSTPAQPAQQSPFNPQNLVGTVALQALEELRLLSLPQGVSIDVILWKYIMDWRGFGNDLAMHMALQKRIYMVLLRLLPPQTHAAIRQAIIREYADEMRSHRDTLKLIKQRVKLEMEDIKMFDKWIDDGAKGDKIPILKSYHKFMQGFNVTCNDSFVAQC
jgi:hypothetical protein